ncbi:antiterminator Q family protein [Aliidiomarina sp. Khilg15.8]
MAGIQLERDTSWLLEQWARWARSNPELARIDYPSVQPYTRMVSKGIRGSCLIDESEALEIDQLLARLNTRDEDMGRATVLYYWLNSNSSLVARVLGIPRARVNVLISSGTAWVDALFYAKSAI